MAATMNRKQTLRNVPDLNEPVDLIMGGRTSGHCEECGVMGGLHYGQTVLETVPGEGDRADEGWALCLSCKDKWVARNLVYGDGTGYYNPDGPPII